MKMMAKKPADRYQSMQDVAHALKQWLADRGLGSSGSGLGSGGGDFSSSGRLRGGAPPIARRLTQAVAPCEPARFRRVAQDRCRIAAGGTRIDRNGFQLRPLDRHAHALDRASQTRQRRGFRSEPPRETVAQGDAAGRLDPALRGRGPVARLPGRCAGPRCPHKALSAAIGRGQDASETQAEERRFQMGLDRHWWGDAVGPDPGDPRQLDVRSQAIPPKGGQRIRIETFGCGAGRLRDESTIGEAVKTARKRNVARQQWQPPAAS